MGTRVETNGVESDGRVVTCDKYTYAITSSDSKMEQEAFEADEGYVDPLNLSKFCYSL